MGLDNAELNTHNLQRFNVATLQVSFRSLSVRTYAKRVLVFTLCIVLINWNQLQLARVADSNPHGPYSIE